MHVIFVVIGGEPPTKRLFGSMLGTDRRAVASGGIAEAVSGLALGQMDPSAKPWARAKKKWCDGIPR